jgi:hypothetical protein
MKCLVLLHAAGGECMDDMDELRLEYRYRSRYRRPFDGVHMNTAGDMIMATGILRAFGLSDAQLACAREAWLAVPNAMQVGAQPRVSLKQFQQLKAAADKQKRSINEIVNDAISGAISNLLQSAK